MANTSRVHFSYHPSIGTPEGDTYRYLLRNHLFDCKRGKVLANQAITAWWLPYAWQEDDVRARKVAIDCIEQLEQHIAKLRRDFQIPAATLDRATDRSAHPEPWRHVSATAQAPMTEPMLEPEAAPPDDSLYATFDVFEEGS